MRILRSYLSRSDSSSKTYLPLAARLTELIVDSNTSHTPAGMNSSCYSSSLTDGSADGAPEPPLRRQVLLIRHAESEENVREVQALRVVKKLVNPGVTPYTLQCILITICSSSGSESLLLKTYSTRCYSSSHNYSILTHRYLPRVLAK